MASERYSPKDIEPKWQKYWEEHKTFAATEDTTKEKFYGLIEFPYPSGAGLHVGHPRPFTAMDVITRKKRMEGKNVLFPIGFDAFGLPTENYAIKTGRPPAEVTAENIANFTRQLKMLGYGFDWDRAVDTTDPKYYRWTQWIFLQLFKHGLAYKKNMPINWCLKCKIGLANEEVVDGKCERCGGDVEKRDKEQWMLAITKYADKLLNGLDTVDYIPQAKAQQQNWIGRSEGAEINFELYFTHYVSANDHRGPNGEKAQLTVFTTRPDTLFGATYMVLAPEHLWVKLALQHGTVLENAAEVEAYVNDTKKKTDLERSAEGREKTGVELKGVKAINPVNGEQIPVFIADYVLGGYGTGAIMAVPAHDERDFEFAKKYDLPIKQVVFTKGSIGGVFVENIEQWKMLDFGAEWNSHYSEYGISTNSEFLDGLTTTEAKEKMIQYLEEKNIGKRKVQFKLRDWVFSRQRYWGEPIPLVHCDACKGKKYNYIIIHGYNSSSSTGFKPWLKQELEKQGHKVWNPDLPNSNMPNVEEQADFIRQHAPFTLDENTIFVGHSLGGAVLYRLLEEQVVPVHKTVFVDPVVTPTFNDNTRPEVEKSTTWKFDWKKVAAGAKQCVVLADVSYRIIRESDIAMLGTVLGCPVWKISPEHKHFSSADGRVTQEPVILDACVETGWIPLSEDQLPLELPKVEKYEPTDTGESPLSAMSEWVQTACPKCGSAARRETDTMPNWAGSSWYFLAYTMGKENGKYLWDRSKMDYWNPVDWYNGGMEHTVLHLLYSRFWNQFLFDIGAVPTSEPYKKRTSHGMILASDGQKMSKSLGNVVNPDEMVEKFGTDAFRTYIMFMGPFDQAVAWDTNGLVGVRRFLDRVYGFGDKVGVVDGVDGKLEAMLHQTIKAVTEGIETMRFNVAVARMMEFSNELSKQENITKEMLEIFLKLLSPFAPHIAEELWARLGHSESISFASWPAFDETKMVATEMTIVAQVNGKIRDEFVVSPDISEEEIKALVLGSEKVQKWFGGKEPKKVIYVKGKLVSIVV